MLLDRAGDHEIGRVEEGSSGSEACAPMALFLAWSMSRAEGCSLAEMLPAALERVLDHEALDSSEIADELRDFAEGFYGHAYFDLVRSTFRKTYPVLERVDAKKLDGFGAKLDRARKSWKPDPDTLTAASTLRAIREAGDPLRDAGYQWDSRRAAFVRPRGHHLLVLATTVNRNDSRRGQIGVHTRQSAELRDDRVERIVATIPETLETATLRFPVVSLALGSFEIPHAGKLAGVAAEIVAQLLAAVSWHDRLADDRAILQAFPRPGLDGFMNDVCGDAGWPFRRGMFAILSTQESVEQATAIFKALGHMNPYIKSPRGRELWERCVAATQLRAAEVTPYDPKQRYRAGAVIAHPKFGEGEVTAASGSTMTVKFPTGERTLAMGRS